MLRSIAHDKGREGFVPYISHGRNRDVHTSHGYGPLTSDIVLRRRRTGCSRHGQSLLQRLDLNFSELDFHGSATVNL